MVQCVCQSAMPNVNLRERNQQMREGVRVSMCAALYSRASRLDCGHEQGAQELACAHAEVSRMRRTASHVCAHLVQRSLEVRRAVARVAVGASASRRSMSREEAGKAARENATVAHVAQRGVHASSIALEMKLHVVRNGMQSYNMTPCLQRRHHQQRGAVVLNLLKT